jgi:NAD-dependent SIR2 family protein deacetylase
MVRQCITCEEEFDTESEAKRQVGGKITTCPDCSTEPQSKYLGLQSADAKGIGVTILKFDSEAEREKYRQAWAANSGTQRMRTTATTAGIKFQKVSESGLGMNHKGKA